MEACNYAKNDERQRSDRYRKRFPSDKPSNNDGADTKLTNRKCHRTKSPDRRYFHDVADNREQDVRDFFDKIKHQRAATTKAVQGEAKENRDQQDLQDLAFRKRVNEGRGNDRPSEKSTVVCIFPGPV